MTTSHTPGPWLHMLDIVYDGNDIKIATISRDAGRVQANANSCLIAAAPDLLAALQKIMKYADSEPDGGVTVEMHRANIEQARAAIAKATQ